MLAATRIIPSFVHQKGPVTRKRYLDFVPVQTGEFKAVWFGSWAIASKLADYMPFEKVQMWKSTGDYGWFGHMSRAAKQNGWRRHKVLGAAGIVVQSKCFGGVDGTEPWCVTHGAFTCLVCCRCGEDVIHYFPECACTVHILSQVIFMVAPLSEQHPACHKDVLKVLRWYSR